MASSLKGKKILVTGAGRGIGYDLVKSLIEDHGSIVYALTKSKDKLDNLIRTFPSEKLIPLLVDLSNWEETEKVLETIGVVDGLVNNAGVAIPEEFLSITKDSFDTLINVNLRAIVCVSQIVVKKMIANGVHGSIVNVSSVGNTLSAAGLLIYGTTKAGVDRLTKGMAFELGPSQIRVNAVNPTVVLTDMGKQLWSDEKKAKRVKEGIPLGKFAESIDVINSIVFLLDNVKSAMITGQCLAIDGGALTFGVRP